MGPAELHLELLFPETALAAPALSLRQVPRR